MAMLNRIAISRRLLGAFLLLAVCGAAIGAIGVLSTSRMNDRAQLTYGEDLAGLKFAARAESDVIAAGRALDRSLLVPDEKSRAELLAEARRTLDNARTNLDGALPLFRNEQGSALAELAVGAFEQYNAAFGELARVVEQEKPGDHARSAPILFGSYGDAAASVGTALHAMVEWKVSSSKENAEETADSFRSSTILMLALTAAGVA